MGKRRRPTRKTNYQSLEDIKVDNMRMAGDELSLLMEAVPERELGPAYERLLEKTQAMNTIDRGLQQAGIPAAEFSGFQRLSMPRLQGGVPAPYVDNSVPGIERRIHLTDMPTAMGNEVIPVWQDDTQSFLTTEFGKGVNLEGQDKASEYVQDHALRLMGFTPQRGPHAGIDFQVPRDGTTGPMVGVDGQTIGAGQAPVVELYTKVIPSNRPRGDYGYGYASNRPPKVRNTVSNQNAIRNDVNASLTNAMNEGRTLQEAVEFLVDGGYFRDVRGMKGKLYKTDYDKVLMPVQNMDQHVQNRRQGDTIAIAPDDILEYNLNEIRDVISGIRDPRQAKLTYNAGNSGNDEARIKVRAEVPGEYITRVADESPMVQQLFRQLPYA